MTTIITLKTQEGIYIWSDLQVSTTTWWKTVSTSPTGKFLHLWEYLVGISWWKKYQRALLTYRSKLPPRIHTTHSVYDFYYSIKQIFAWLDFLQEEKDGISNFCALIITNKDVYKLYHDGDVQITGDDLLDNNFMTIWSGSDYVKWAYHILKDTKKSPRKIVEQCIQTANYFDLYSSWVFSMNASEFLEANIEQKT